jgi:hypothetical protein
MSGEVLMKALLGEEFPEVSGIDKNGARTRVASDMIEGGVFSLWGDTKATVCRSLSRRSD